MPRLLIAIALCLLAGCASIRTSRVETLSGEAMGTTWTVKFVRPKQSPDLQELQRGIQQQLDNVDAQMSTWKPDLGSEPVQSCCREQLADIASGIIRRA